MSPIGLAMDLVLAALLIAALLFGYRLNRRLKTLRDGQEMFGRAVLELSQAAARAEAGLQALRAATTEAEETLAYRIDTARALARKLEQGGRLVAVNENPPVIAARDEPLTLPAPSSAPTRSPRRRDDEDLFHIGGPSSSSALREVAELLRGAGGRR